jgi:peptide/nickel transport system substrate-binding protein
MEEDMMERERLLDDLLQAARAGSLSRRDVLRRALGLGLGLPTIGILLAACGGDDDDDDGDDDTPTNTPEAGGGDPTEVEEEPTEPEEEDPTEEPAGDATEEPEDATEAPEEATATEADTGGSTAQSLSFDAATTGGGGGQANTALIGYCYVASGGSMFEVRRLVDSRLIAWMADLSDFVGEIAEEWSVDETTITFNLRQNAAWHDGTPLTSADVLFTYNLIANPETASRYAGAFSFVVGYEALKAGEADTLEGLTAPDDYTVVIELTQPDSGILPQLPDIDILPSHILAGVSGAAICEDAFWIDDNRIGSGPYRWGQLVEAQRIELEAFEDYYLGAPNIAQINLLLFGNYETSLAAFEEGSNMAAPLNADNLEYAQGFDFARIETQSTGVLALFVNGYNPDIPLFGDKRVRQAMSYAIDRQAIAEALYLGLAAEPTYRTTPWLDWTDSPDLNHYDYDPDRARELLEEAGWGLEADVEFTLWYYYPDQVTAAVVQAIQQYLGEVGITAVPRLNEGGAMAEEQNNNTWGLIYGAWGIGPPVNMTQVWRPDEDSVYRYSNPEFEELMATARATFDVDEQRDAYSQAVAILNDELPFVWLFNRQNLVVVNEKLDTAGPGGWAAGSLMYHNFIEDWTLES